MVCFAEVDAIYRLPFARSKIRELTNDMGVLPVLLGMYEPKPLLAAENR